MRRVMLKLVPVEGEAGSLQALLQKKKFHLNGRTVMLSAHFDYTGFSWIPFFLQGL